MTESITDQATYQSKDFFRVPATLKAKLPEILIHKKVAGTVDTGSGQFSIERKHPVHIVDLPSFSLNMTVGGLLPGQETNKHRHNYETIIYVIEGEGVTTIEDRQIEWQAGDAIYIPVWAWHQHKNLSTEKNCLYIACENAAMLQNMGGIALREEGN